MGLLDTIKGPKGGRGNGCALASYPRSGNTWARKLLESSSGRESGSLYQDRVFTRGKSGVVVKTHERSSAGFESAIWIVRNPFDSIYSGYKHVTDVQKKDPQPWSDYIAEQTEYWRLHAEYWADAKLPKLLIRYEDMLAAPTFELLRMCTFLSIKIDRASLDAIVGDHGIEQMRKMSDLGASFFRSGTIGDGYRHFSVEERQTMRDALKEELALLHYDQSFFDAMDEGLAAAKSA